MQNQPGAQVKADHWTLATGALASSDNGFHLTPQSDEVNVTLTRRLLQPGHSYAVSFLYRNNLSGGAERVYVSAHNDALQWLDTFPSGLGYDCMPTRDWTRQGFAFIVPKRPQPLSSCGQRATGYGSADFSDVALQPLP